MWEELAGQVVHLHQLICQPRLAENALYQVYVSRCFTLLVGQQYGHPACKKVVSLFVNLLVVTITLHDLHLQLSLPLPSSASIKLANLGSPEKNGR